MDSWVLKGDSYSFLRSSPNNFNLQHLDGPNRVEIFDITCIPSHRSAISETTCLCDIFGDDCESPALSSSPASSSFLKKDVDEQLPVEDVKDSSGSYHTANGSEHLSDGTDTFEDSEDTKDAVSTPAIDFTLQSDKSEVTFANGTPKSTENREVSCLSQETSLAQVENVSDHQLVVSTSEFRDTNIRVTGSTHEIISPDLLSENKCIGAQSRATSSELGETDPTEDRVTPHLRRDVSISEQKECHSTEKITKPDASPENRCITEQRYATTPEVKETDSTQGNTCHKQGESTFSENKDSLDCLASDDDGCSGEGEEKNSLPDILPMENSSLVCETLISDPTFAQANVPDDGTDFTPVQKTLSDPSTKDGRHDLREMSAPLEHEDVPNKSAYIDTFLHDDKTSLSDLEERNSVSPPLYAEANIETDADPTPQHFNISSETRETISSSEDCTLSSFSDMTEGMLSSAISELYTPPASSEDLISSESSIIIHSPVGFTVCHSPQLKTKIWSTGPEDLAFRPESPENGYRSSVSSFDSKLCSSPEPRSITSTPESNQNIFMHKSSPALSSCEPRCSPEIERMTCDSLTQHSKSPQVETKAPQNDFSSRNEVVQTNDEGTMHAEHFISTALPIKEVTDMTIPAISNLPPAQGGISSQSPRGTKSPDPKETICTGRFTSDQPRMNDIINVAFSSNFSSTDRCRMSPHEVSSTLSNAEASNVLELRSTSMIPLTNDIKSMAILPFSNISSVDGATSRSPSNLSIPRDTTSPDVLGTRSTRSSMLTASPTENVETPAPSTEALVSRSPSILSAPRNSASPGVDGLICMEIQASTTILTNESTLKAISPLSSDLATTSNQSPPRDSLPPDAKRTKDPQSLISTKLPVKNIENMVITPCTHLSSTELDHYTASSSSTSSTPRNILMSPDVEESRCEERSPLTILPTNETRNMAVSPISNLSSKEEPSSTLSIPQNTTYPAVINEMTDMAYSPINLSGIIRPPSNLSVSRDVMCLEVEKTNYMEQSNEVPIKEATDLAVSPIFNGLTTQQSISAPLSSSSLPRTITSIDADGLRCVESPTPTIPPTNMGITRVFSVSPSNGDLSNTPSTLGIPRHKSFDVHGKRNTEKSNELPANETIIKANSSISNLISTDGDISRPSSFLNTSEDTNPTSVDGVRCTESPISTILPRNPVISPVYQLSSTDKGISIQPFNLNIPTDTLSPDVEGTKFISNLKRSPTVQSSSMMTYQRSPDRSNYHIPLPEMCITLDSECSAPVNLMAPLTVPADEGQIEDTGYKMSLKSQSLRRCECTLVPCIQPEKISDSLSEPPTPRLSVKQIKENWEKMNESILNSLNPWQTSKKTVPEQTAKEAKEGNDSKREPLERESASGAKTIMQMAKRPGESPSVLHSNNHNVYEGQSCRNKGWSGARVIQEEHMLGKGVGAIAEGSYRGEQVELSFSTRNRKGPANRSPAPSSRDPKSGIPPRYFQSPLATRRQQSLLRAQNLQKDNKICARRVRSTSQSNYSAADHLSSECSSETSSMGSEFDDADSEVKWFTDQTFRSLSSPQVDYLDVYNSSHGSSTNVSHPSTVDSPGSATWICYADLRDSMHEDDASLCHASFLPPGTLDPARRFEMGGFECVDVAMENKGETRKGKRTVPKRQIQFKKCNSDELKSNENDENAMESLSTQVSSTDSFVRQHSPQASVQEDLVEGGFQTGKKMLQKSASLDESIPKSKKASNIIKNVLSKKMDTATKESSRDEPCEDTKKHIGDLTAGESSNINKQSSSLPSECSLSSDNFVGKEETSPNPQKKGCRPKVPPKPVFKANCLSFNRNSADLEFLGKASEKDQIKPIVIDAFESKISKKQIVGNSEQEASKLGEKCSSGSRSVMNQSPNCTAICVASTQRSSTNSDSKHSMTLETYKQQEGSNSMFLSKTPEITLKPCTNKDKNKPSLKTSFCSHPEISTDSICESMLEFEERSEQQMRFKTRVEPNTEEDDDQNKVKSVIHKVRDVRKLVKNTYNLSFDASNTSHKVEDVVFEKSKETQPENLHPLHIECKAISLKDKTVSCNSSMIHQDVTHTDEKSTMSQMDSPKRSAVNIAERTAKASLAGIRHSDVDLFVGLDTGNNTSNSVNCEQSINLEIPSRPSSKEISTLVFLHDSTPKSVQKPTSPGSPDIKPAGHSLSMLLKEKGMQADIGVCDEGSGAKPKHINRLEVPLQTYPSEGSSSESQKLKTEDADLPPDPKASINSSLQTSESTLQVRSSPKPKEVKVFPNSQTGDNQSQRASLEPSEDITVATTSTAQVRTFSSNTKIHAMPVTTSKEIELPIQVRSISSDRPKPPVLPKPNYKQPFSEIRSTSTDITPTRSFVKEQADLKSDDKRVETSATVMHNEQINKSNNTKTLAVPAVSSHKPQAIPVTRMPSSVPKSTDTAGGQEVRITSVQNSSDQTQQNIQEHMIADACSASNHQTLQAVSQASTYMQPSVTSSNNLPRTDDFHFRTSDDPPSYDERESFSPLQLSDLPPRRQTRYHPTSKHSLCSCTSCTQPQFGQPYHGSQNQTPPGPQSPGQVISYPGAPPQAQVRPHQCRPDDQPSNYPSVSKKTTVQQAPTLIQPMHHSHAYSAPALQRYGNEQKQTSTQLMDRCSGNQRSPQATSGATYREHNRSPTMATLDPRSQFFNPQELPPAFGHEYGSEGSGAGSVLYPENASSIGFGQGPRRVLLDPETGKYFYIEVPMQPLRKMLFDPEIGQYVEVLIPQQTMSNSSMYPPAAAPYQGPYHGQGLYASHYLPYAMPPHPQSAQQPRHSESSVPTSLHQNTIGYGSTASQVPKSDVKGHPSLDQSYLESMYYIPTGMNASPNSTPSDCFHKPATNMPAAGGRRA